MSYKKKVIKSKEKDEKTIRSVNFIYDTSITFMILLLP